MSLSKISENIFGLASKRFGLKSPEQPSSFTTRILLVTSYLLSILSLVLFNYILPGTETSDIIFIGVVGSIELIALVPLFLIYSKTTYSGWNYLTAFTINLIVVGYLSWLTLGGAALILWTHSFELPGIVSIIIGALAPILFALAYHFEIRSLGEEAWKRKLIKASVVLIYIAALPAALVAPYIPITLRFFG